MNSLVLLLNIFLKDQIVWKKQDTFYCQVGMKNLKFMSKSLQDIRKNIYEIGQDGTDIATDKGTD